MLDQSLTVGNLLVINAATILPVVVLLGRGVWYLSKMVHQHDQMWRWFSSRSARERAAAELSE